MTGSGWTNWEQQVCVSRLATALWCHLYSGRDRSLWNESVERACVTQLHPWDISAPAPSPNLHISCSERRRRQTQRFGSFLHHSSRASWAVWIMIMILRMGKGQMRFLIITPLRWWWIQALLLSDIEKGHAHWLIFFKQSKLGQCCFFFSFYILCADTIHSLVKVFMLGCKNLRGEIMTSFPPDLSITQTQMHLLCSALL